ncbi:MAG: hypothetical protein ACLFQP_00570 [Halothece sp.]
MSYYVKQWVEAGGVMCPEYGYSEPEPEAQTDELLDKPFDELTKEEWEQLESTDNSEF